MGAFEKLLEAVLEGRRKPERALHPKHRLGRVDMNLASLWSPGARESLLLGGLCLSEFGIPTNSPPYRDEGPVK